MNILCALGNLLHLDLLHDYSPTKTRYPAVRGRVVESEKTCWRCGKTKKTIKDSWM